MQFCDEAQASLRQGRGRASGFHRMAWVSGRSRPDSAMPPGSRLASLLQCQSTGLVRACVLRFCADHAFRHRLQRAGRGLRGRCHRGRDWRRSYNAGSGQGLAANIRDWRRSYNAGTRRGLTIVGATPVATACTARPRATGTARYARPANAKEKGAPPAGSPFASQA